jgi:hypothetical protein
MTLSDQDTETDVEYAKVVHGVTTHMTTNCTHSVRFEVLTAVTMNSALIPDIENQFLFHRRYRV